MAATLPTAPRADRPRFVPLPPVRLGGPRRPHRSGARATASDTSLSPLTSNAGSHMPLDTGIHWHWRNPLNVLPGILLVLLLIALVSLVL